MKSVLKLFISIVLSSLLLSCVAGHRNKSRATQLLEEINEISRKSKENMLSEDIASRIKRVEENREDFPSSREIVKKDAKSVVSFFAKTIEENKQIIQKYEELLKLGLVKPEADCIKHTIKSLNAGTEKTEIMLTQYNLFFDEDVKDKETLESKTLSIREKIKETDKKIAEIEEQEKAQCAGKEK